MHVSVQPILWWPLVAVCGLGLLALVIWAYATALANESGRWRWLAFGLRLAALALALAAMVRPSLVFTETRRQDASLILLYDHSRSMLVADAWDGLPRWRAMNQTIARSRDALTRLQELLEIREYHFDSKLAERT